ncbi:MAG: hypothetical protein AAGF44_03620 [Pseudomonadota bacterium]
MFNALDPLAVGPDDLLIRIDDAMRLVQAMDYQQGQGWFDLQQYRLGSEDSHPMHWSRVVDAPLALLISVFESWADADHPVYAAAALWPVMCGVLIIGLYGLIGARLGGRMGLILIGLLTTLSVVTFFQPGRVDHHYVQSILMLAMTALLIARPGSTWHAAFAGALVCLSLGVGVSELPIIIAASAVLALRWAFSLPDARNPAMGFFAALALGAPFALLLTTPPGQWLVAWCDALSIVYLAGLVLGSAIVATAAFLLPAARAPIARLGVLAVALGAAVAAAVSTNPDCLAGPYVDLDATTTEWISEREEVRGIREVIDQGDMRALFSLTVWPLVGIVGLLLAMMTAPAAQRFAWVLLGAMAIAGWVISLNQIRGINSSLVFATFGVMFLMIRAIAWRGMLNAIKPVMLVALWFSQQPFAIDLLVRQEPVSSEAGGGNISQILAACTGDSQLAPLAALSRGRVATSIEFGPFILLRSDHWTLGSPHHRSYAGNRAAIEFNKAGERETYQILADWQIDYVVTCDLFPFTVWSGVGASWLAERVDDDLPAWLEPTPSVAPARIFRFVPG